VDLCLGCRACEVACPSGVQYGELLESTRAHIEKHYQRTAFQTFLRRVTIEKVFPFPGRMKFALFAAKLIRFVRAEFLLPQFAGDALALIPPKTKEARLPEISRAPSPAKGRLGFVRGCVMNVMFGDTNEASIRLLNRAGYDVVTPATQSCCGALHAHGGNLEEARVCARQNIQAFEAQKLEVIIINAAGCGSTLKEYGHLLANDPCWAERAAAFSAKVKDLTEVLSAEQFKVQSLRFKVVTYHDACHLAHAQRITKGPRELVKAVAGENLVELPESEVCCGSAGSYNLTEPEMAERLQLRKVENILRSGAEVVVTTNPGCILQIRAGLKKAGAEYIEVIHIADFLDRASTHSGNPK
jgi:glycolate oxidase iron-sulfur subunit